ncbi:hypothetical protein, partial [Burkholderia pseudomallei]|uniref:hypothetical protein n=1 Tax=Burkholderia pseudomallei TaxID=28450 RepID=UPI001C4B7A03
MALVSLGFANCELRKALIYKGLWCADKTPKAALDSTPFGIYVDIAAHCLARLTCLISSGHFNLGERPRLLQLNNTAA